MHDNQLTLRTAARHAGNGGSVSTVTTYESKEEVRSAALEARSALQTPTIRSTICRFLAPLTGKSAREVAIELAKACIPLIVAGQLIVPASPLVWGLIGFAATRIGTAWLCGDDTT